MSVNIDNLVQRQAAIFAEIDSLSGQELESLANSPLPEGAVSARLRRHGSCCVGFFAPGTSGAMICFYRRTSSGSKASSFRRCRAFSLST